VRKGVTVVPHTPGGGQERRRRAGTENTTAIAGFGVAARLAARRVDHDASAVAALRDRLESELLGVGGARVIGAGVPRLPNTSAILFEGIPGEALLIRLDLEGVAVSTGSACSSGTLAPSPALLSLGLSRDEARSVVRFSLGRGTTADEIARAAGIVRAAVTDIRRSGAESADGPDAPDAVDAAGTAVRGRA